MSYEKQEGDKPSLGILPQIVRSLVDWRVYLRNAIETITPCMKIKDSFLLRMVFFGYENHSRQLMRLDGRSLDVNIGTISLSIIRRANR